VPNNWPEAVTPRASLPSARWIGSSGGNAAGARVGFRNSRKPQTIM